MNLQPAPTDKLKEVDISELNFTELTDEVRSLYAVRQKSERTPLICGIVLIPVIILMLITVWASVNELQIRIGLMIFTAFFFILPFLLMRDYFNTPDGFVEGITEMSYCDDRRINSEGRTDAKRYADIIFPQSKQKVLRCRIPVTDKPAPGTRVIILHRRRGGYCYIFTD